MAWNGRLTGSTGRFAWVSGTVVRHRAPRRTLLQPQGAHQAQGRATRHRKPFALELPPDLAGTVDREVLVIDPANLPAEGFVPVSPGR